MLAPRQLAQGQALGRAAFGVALVLAPRRVAAPWVGKRAARRDGTAVITRAMGARDLALGLGTVRAVIQGHGAAPWVAAGVLADATDLLATWHARAHIPALGAAGVVVLAGSSTALGVWLRTQID